MHTPFLTRRRLLGAACTLPWLTGCSSPLPLDASQQSDPAARALLNASAEAHGLAAYRGLRDINLSYDGEWRPLIDRIQPEVVDAGYRGSSQERILPRSHVVAQHYSGPKGRKHVVWRGGGPPSAPGEVAVWFNDAPSRDPRLLDAAALVAEGYGLFLLGPLWIHDRDLPLRLAGTEAVDGRICDVVEAWLAPGLGRVARDRVALCIDRADGLMRRVRFTLEGFDTTRGAVAEVDTFEHERRFGMWWPRRSFERVLHPLRLPAHDWRLTGLDVNRDYGPAALDGPRFTGAAAAPAERL